MADTDQDIAHRGAAAALARAELRRRVGERTEALLGALIGRHRSKDGLSGDDAKAGIAAIGEMRLLLEDVNRDIRQGEQARERMMAPGREDSAERTR